MSGQEGAQTEGAAPASHPEGLKLEGLKVDNAVVEIGYSSEEVCIAVISSDATGAKRTIIVPLSPLKARMIAHEINGCANLCERSQGRIKRF